MTNPVRSDKNFPDDNREHCDQVLAFAQQLRRDGIDAELDQFHQDELVHWPRWCEEQLRPENSKYVLCVYTTARERAQHRCPLRQTHERLPPAWTQKRKNAQRVHADQGVGDARGEGRDRGESGRPLVGRIELPPPARLGDAMRGELESEGKGHLFEALQGFLLGREDASYQQVADALSLSLGALKTAIHRLRGRYRALLREEVARTVATPGEVDEEFRYLRAALRG